MTTESQRVVSGFVNECCKDTKSDISTDAQNREDIELECPQNVQKLKTELCKNYTQYQYCPYGNRCRFAHGPDELKQNMNPNNKYKTKICFNFFGKNFCKFGDRCNYLHKRPTDELMKKKIWKNMIENNRQVIIESRPKSRLFPVPF